METFHILMDVSKEEHVKEGFFKYTENGINYEILVNNVKQGVALDTHKHLFHQFGYCFQGKFSFWVNEKPYIIDQGKSYNLNGCVEHGAEFITDIIALDFKYSPPKENSQRNEILCDVLKEKEFGIKEFSVGYVKIEVIQSCYFEKHKELEVELAESSFLISDINTILMNENENVNVEQGRIYRIHGTQGRKMNFEFSKPGLILLVLIDNV